MLLLFRLRSARLTLGLCVFALGFALAACPTGGNGGDGGNDGGATDAGADAGGTWPAARTDLYTPIGSPETLEIATWNIENYPANARTPPYAAGFIRSLDLDLVAVQEIADESAFEELVGRLPEHDGVLSTHTYSNGSYQKLGLIYRTGLITLSNVTLIFEGSGYNFPRPPLQATVTVDDGVGEVFDFTVIVVHLKALSDPESIQRRTDAIIQLESYVRSRVEGAEDDEIVVLGDFNDVLDLAGGREVFEPFLDPAGDYTIHTDQPAQNGLASFIQSGALLDHVITTRALDDETGGVDALVPTIDTALSSYTQQVSDHRPVVLVFPQP